MKFQLEHTKADFEGFKEIHTDEMESNKKNILLIQRLMKNCHTEIAIQTYRDTISFLERRIIWNEKNIKACD
ncbi:MAG TPA: hypothetical protein VNX68_00275, partial [Nitrosopumilaceae archaeon]|nr:hypothetical protein [Nitrosopumilaceae archaeon]